jgi:hypothetical protein
VHELSFIIDYHNREMQAGTMFYTVSKNNRYHRITEMHA